MAFNEKNLFSAMGTAGSAPSMFTYISDDSVSTVNTSGYFNKSRGALKNNDIYAINFNFDRSHKAR